MPRTEVQPRHRSTRAGVHRFDLRSLSGPKRSVPRTPLRALWRPWLAVCVLIFGIGCSPPADPNRSTTPDVPEVALVMKSLANEFFVTMADGARAHQAESGGRYDLVVNGMQDENDLAQQVRLMQQMIARGVDAIVVAPADSKALVPVVRQAVEAGIVVVNIDNRLDRELMESMGLAIPFVGPDNRAGALEVGRHLAAALGGSSDARVAIIEGIPTAFNSQERRLGFEQAMKESAIEVVSVTSAGWEQAPANTVASALLSEYPDLAALLCANDNMALGAAAAIRQSGRNDVLLVGFDNISAVEPLLRQGALLATADQHADQLAVFGIEVALSALASGELGPPDRETPVDLVTIGSLDEAD